jgi:hypothetical protein
VCVRNSINDIGCVGKRHVSAKRVGGRSQLKNEKLRMLLSITLKSDRDNSFFHHRSFTDVHLTVGGRDVIGANQKSYRLTHTIGRSFIVGTCTLSQHPTFWHNKHRHCEGCNLDLWVCVIKV